MIHNHLLSSPCEVGRISSPTRGLFFGFFDEVDTASGARGDWRRDPDGNDGAAGAVSFCQIELLGSMPMRLAALLSLVLLSPGVVYAHDSHKARASDKSKEVATAKAMRRVPGGATVTDTSCKKLNYVLQTRWRCTITYSD